MSETISRQAHQGDPDKFERLYQLGITYIQELSGKVWTDYNTHDPGITILEQVCFALTDVIYRCDFPVADILADEYGRVDYSKLGLESHQNIMAPPPQSISEYEAFIAAKLPQIERAWFKPSESAPHSGLYEVSGLLQRFYQKPAIEQRLHQKKQSTLTEQTAPLQHASISQQLLAAYYPTRGLCEDIDQIKIIGEQGVELLASVELGDAETDANEVAARIYDHTATWLRERVNDDLSLLYASLLTIPSVIRVNSLDLINYCSDSDPNNSNSFSGNGPHSEQASLPKHASLVIPESDKFIGLTLIQNQHKITLDAGDIAIQIELLRAKKQASNIDSPVANTLPTGQYIQLGGYESIQTLFPRNYQLATKIVNRYDEKSQAERHQLRSYLLLFDQLMANFCQDINQLAELYSSNYNTGASYQFHQLSDAEFYTIDSHYPEDASKRLKALQAKFDPYPERKGRVFDYLIALYGEQYPDTFHRTFSPYSDEQMLDWQLLEYKQQFIRNIATITNQRGISDNLNDSLHRGGYSQRLALLLGLTTANNQQGASSTTTEFLLNVVPDKDYRRSDIGNKALFELKSTIEPLMHSLSESTKHLPLSIQKKKWLRASIYALSGQTLPESLLQLGIDHHRYRILPHNKNNEFRLFFDMGEGHPQRWLYLCRYDRLDKLKQICSWLQSWFIELNQQSETLYVVEPIMLRASSTELKNNANTVTLVLPGFTARHYNPVFRQQAEELIRHNTPAHLGLQVLWLDFCSFYEFENLYLDWRKHKAQSLSDPNDATQELCKNAAQNLARYLSKPEYDNGRLLL